MRNTKVRTQAKLYSAIQSNDTFTENGMPTHSTSGSYLLDMFFKMGGARSLSENEILSLFVNAFNENPVLAIKAIFYSRDIRFGQGERRFFRICFKFLCNNFPEYALKIIDLIPNFGRWDDIFEAFDTPIEEQMCSLVYNQLQEDLKELN